MIIKSNLSLEQRIEALERCNRCLKWCLGTAAGIAAGISLMAFTQDDSVPALIQAREFQVVAADGSVVLKLQDSFGSEVHSSGSIAIFNVEGQRIVNIHSSPSGAGQISTLNSAGKRLFAVSDTSWGTGRLSLHDRHGNANLLMGGGPDGSGLVLAMDPNGREGEGQLTTIPGVLTPSLAGFLRSTEQDLHRGIEQMTEEMIRKLSEPHAEPQTTEERP